MEACLRTGVVLGIEAECESRVGWGEITQLDAEHKGRVD